MYADLEGNLSRSFLFGVGYTISMISLVELAKGIW